MAKLNVMHSLMLSVWEGLSNHKPQASSYIKHMPSSVFFCSITFASLTVSKPLHGPKQKGWGKRRGSRVHVESPQLCGNSSEWFRIFILIAQRDWHLRDATTNTFHKAQVNYRLTHSIT